MTSILIIGGGNMGAALAMRWRGAWSDLGITISEQNPDKRAQLREEGFDAPDELVPPAEGWDAIILAVKPQSFPELVPHLVPLVGNALVISIMAGVPLAALHAAGITNAARVMPNTPAMIGEGMSASYATGLSEEHLAMLRGLLEVTGFVIELPNEELMHAVTAISGSGPAYLYSFVEALQAAAIKLGLPEDVAYLLARQTTLGAGLLLEASGAAPNVLREQVTSPGGTTEAALKALQEKGFDRAILAAVEAAHSRSKSM